MYYFMEIISGTLLIKYTMIVGGMGCVKKLIRDLDQVYW